MTVQPHLLLLEGRGAGHREVRGARKSGTSTPASALQKQQMVEPASTWLASLLGQPWSEVDGGTRQVVDGYSPRPL